MPKVIDHVDPAYALVQVRRIDEAISNHKEEIKRLTERRRVFAPHLPKD